MKEVMNGHTAEINQADGTKPFSLVAENEKLYELGFIAETA